MEGLSELRSERAPGGRFCGVAPRVRSHSWVWVQARGPGTVDFRWDSQGRASPWEDPRFRYPTSADMYDITFFLILNFLFFIALDSIIREKGQIKKQARWRAPRMSPVSSTGASACP